MCCARHTDSARCAALAARARRSIEARHPMNMTRKPLMNRLLRTAIVVSLVPLAACAHHRGHARNADLAASRVTTIGVNSYLWRASLDTLGFMPLLQTDSNGGGGGAGGGGGPAAPN